MGKLTLILGGARSGKSMFAERLAGGGDRQVLYIATAQGLDEEMTARIASHRQKRPSTWHTLEIPINVGRVLQSQPIQSDVVLLDCLTLLVSNQLMKASTDVDQPDEKLAKLLVQHEIDDLLTSIQAGQSEWIIVSNEVGMGLVPPYPLGRVYRDLLGWANQKLAVASDQVYFMVAGLPWKLTPPDE